MSAPRAVIYTRVSTEEQVQNLSLPTQEKSCREFCVRKGWQIDQVFVDAGQSAKNTDRTALQQMIAHCRKNAKTSNPVKFLVVHSLNRFARNAFDHQTVRAILAASGVTLCSVTEPIDSSPTGKLMENMVAAFAQFDNDARSVRTITGMRAAKEMGRWTHKAPIGYRLEGKRSTSRMVLDETRASLVKRAFELFATGTYGTSEVLEIVTRAGLTTRRGDPLSPQSFNSLLRRDVYSGWIVDSRTKVRYRGSFPAIIDEATFDRVKEVLGSSRTGSTRQRKNSDFVLKGTVHCGHCNGPLTASRSKGRNDSRYAYYSCWRPNCQKIRVPQEKLESDFLAYLSGLQPKAAFVRLFREVVLSRWREKTVQVNREVSVAKEKIEELDSTRMKLVDLLIDQKISQELFDDRNSRLEAELAAARIAARELELDRIDVEAVLDFGASLLLSIASMWSAATFEQKQRIQRVVLPHGVPYADDRLGNAEVLSIFKHLRDVSSAPVSLVAHTGFEPVLPP